MKITELYVILGTDSEGKEGIVSAVNPVTRIMEPLIGDADRLDKILTIAKAGAKASSLNFELVKFTGRESVTLITPKNDDVKG